MTPLDAHYVWCDTVGCRCADGPHHHHHDYIGALESVDRKSCEACREADPRRDDEWNWPYRWVYDYSPPCVCEAVLRSVEEGAQ